MPIDAVDWSRLEHAYGAASDIPVLWEASLRREPGALEALGAAICHQGDLFTATHALVPSLVELATRGTELPRADVLQILAAIMDGRGPLERRAELASRAPIVLRHPAAPATVTMGGPGTAPDPEELARERAWVRAMKAEIAAHLEAWRALATHPDEDVRQAASAVVRAIERAATPSPTG